MTAPKDPKDPKQQPRMVDFEYTDPDTDITYPVVAIIEADGTAAFRVAEDTPDPVIKTIHRLISYVAKETTP